MVIRLGIEVVICGVETRFSAKSFSGEPFNKSQTSYTVHHLSKISDDPYFAEVTLYGYTSGLRSSI